MNNNKKKRSFNFRQDTIDALKELTDYYGLSTMTSTLELLIHKAERDMNKDLSGNEVEGQED